MLNMFKILVKFMLKLLSEFLFPLHKSEKWLCCFVMVIKQNNFNNWHVL